MEKLLSEEEYDEILSLAVQLQELSLNFTAPQFEATFPEWNAVYSAGRMIEDILKEDD